MTENSRLDFMIIQYETKNLKNGSHKMMSDNFVLFIKCGIHGK